MHSVIYYVTLMAGLAAASPIESTPALVEREARETFERTGIFDLSAPLAARQSTRDTRDDLLNSTTCKDVIFIWARGSTESGNLGSGVGLSLSNALEAAIPSIAIQGVKYAALLTTNLIGGDPAGIVEMRRLWNLANTKCPNSIVIGGGYSQGAALTHRSITDATAPAKAQIEGILLFGDTLRQQTNGSISGLAQDKLLIICNDGDLVCNGTLIVASPHLDYERRVPEAAAFLIGRVQAAQTARIEAAAQLAAAAEVLGAAQTA